MELPAKSISESSSQSDLKSDFNTSLLSSNSKENGFNSPSTSVTSVMESNVIL